jgi:antitoxin component YwqK of YwqJK toxin-antitoxin module
MKKTLLISITILTLMSCGENRSNLFEKILNIGEQRINVTGLSNTGGIFYYNGKPFTGVAFDMYDEKNIKEEINYKDGKVDGRWVSYYQNGQIQGEIIFKDGKVDGRFVSYCENGVKKEETNYKDGKPDGRAVNYYYEDGKIAVDTTVGNDTENDEHGQIKLERNYKDGKPDGRWVVYSKNGQIVQELNFKDGYYDGKQVMYYYKNGKVQKKEYFEKGEYDEKIGGYTESSDVDGVIRVGIPVKMQLF